MTNVFLSVLGVSLSVSLMIAALLLLTPFLNRRYAAKWKYWIWVVLALRLIIPFGGTGRQSAANPQPHMETVKTRDAAESEQKQVDTLTDRMSTGRILVEIPVQLTAPIVMRTEKTGNSITLLDAAAFIWALGGLLFMAVHLFSYFRYKGQILKNGTVLKDEAALCPLSELKCELQIKATVSAVEYAGAVSPMIIGFGKHILVLPKEQYKAEELYFIMKHELVHLKRKDVYFKLLFVMANAVHWFNPFVWIMQKEAAVDMELSCDERVTQGADYAARKAYTETLLSTLHKQCATHKQCVKRTSLSTQFYGGKRIMKKRFKNILVKTGKKNGIVILICAVILTVSLGTLVGCSIAKENVEAAPDQAEDKETRADESLPESVEQDGGEAQNREWPMQIDVTPPSLQEDMSLGADFVILDYADENIVIFHGYFGLFVYDKGRKELIGAVDLASIGCDSTQGDDYCEIWVEKDGSKVYLSPITSNMMYVYNVTAQSLVMEPYDISGIEMFDSFIDPREPEYIGIITSGRDIEGFMSFRGAAVTESNGRIRYGYLLSFDSVGSVMYEEVGYLGEGTYEYEDYLIFEGMFP